MNKKTLKLPKSKKFNSYYDVGVKSPAIVP